MPVLGRDGPKLPARVNAALAQRRAEALRQIQSAYLQLISAVDELAKIDREIGAVDEAPPPTMNAAQVEAALAGHIHRITGKR
jgi:hypothetical protein